MSRLPPRRARSLLDSKANRRMPAVTVLAVVALLAPIHVISAQDGQSDSSNSLQRNYELAQNSATEKSRSDGLQDLAWYDNESRSAVEAENYQSAVKILKEGIAKFPFAVHLNVRLADLYYSKELYNLALEEYDAARLRDPDNFYTLNRIQQCHGFLNQNRDAVRVLERIVTLFPENEDSAVDLGWMYFKTHQLEKGERVLLKAMQIFGATRSLAMTLGTIYSDMYRYNESKSFYLKSIDNALEEGDTAFAAVAYYNLSLLERGFYHYNSAYRYTELSIGQQERPTGHLSKGELLQSRLHFRGALSEYQRGLSLDDSPLTKVNMAILYQKFGLLSYARRYAEEIFRLKDVSWMHYFGTDRDLHMKELYELLADIFSGLSHTSRLSPSRDLWERLRHWSRSIGYRLKSNWYRRKFRDLTFKVGKDYLAKGNYLDAYWEFYQANAPYRNIALKYLFKAKDMETQVKPHAAAYYLQEEGKTMESVALLESSIQKFDRFWEKEAIADSLIAIAGLAKKGSPAHRTALNRLFEINPGALRQIGYGIPLRVSLVHEPDRRRFRRLLIDMIEQTGSETISSDLDATGAEGFRFELQLEWLGPRAAYKLLDTDSGETVSSGRLEVTGHGAREICYGLVNQLLARIYRVR